MVAWNARSGQGVSGEGSPQETSQILQGRSVLTMLVVLGHAALEDSRLLLAVNGAARVHQKTCVVGTGNSVII